MNSTKRLSKNLIYALMQMLFWMGFCSCYGFASYYLTENGFGTSIVGIVTAIAGILSAIGQPVIGAWADKPGVGFKKPFILVLAVMSVFGIVLLFFSKSGIGVAICISYGLVMLLLSLSTPLLNAVGMAFPDEINFGIGRGIGSLGYAIASYLIGYLTASLGSVIIPIFATAISIIMLFITMLMPNKVTEATESAETAGTTESAGLSELTESAGAALSDKSPKKKNSGFLRNYPVFTFLWVVFIFMLTVHNLSNTYLLQILEKGGGNSYNLGIAVAIAAVVELPVLFFYEKINTKISTQNLLIIAAASYVLKSVLQLVNSNLMVFYFIQLLQMSSWGIYASASVYYVREIIPFKDQIKAQAYMANALMIGTVIGTFVGGQLIERINVNAMLVFQNVMAALGLIGILIWKRKFKKSA